MTDLEFFQEFLRRFNLENDLFPVQMMNDSIAYEILLRDNSEEEKGLLDFSFDAKTGEFIDDKPCLTDTEGADLEEQLKSMDYNETINTIRFLLDELQDNF